MVRGARVVLLCVAVAGCDQVFSLDRPVIPDAPDAPPDAPPPTENWAIVAGGTQHTCGVRLDHTLWCWGRNDLGQLGLGVLPADRERIEPAQVGTDADWESVSVGDNTSCAIKTDHSLWCWGLNDQGQIGDGTKEDRAVPTRVTGSFVSVTNGTEHTCAIDPTMGMSCWGNGSDGALGNGATDDKLVPMPVGNGGSWQIVRAGDRSTCAIQVGGALFCWGSNAEGRLGTGAGVPQELTPRRVGTELWKALDLDHGTACAIRDVGLLRCWGENNRGQIGDSSNSQRNVPTAVGADEFSDWTAVARGFEHTCGVHGAGELACWGLNAHGQAVTDLSRESRAAPADVIGGDAPWVSLGLGRRHTCVIDMEGKLWCAGYAADGALGSEGGSVRTPVSIGMWTSVAAGEDATCGLDSTSRLACWGSNRVGLLGDGFTRDRMAPSPTMPRTYTSVDLGDHGCALTASDRWCWGANERGQLGNGTFNNSSSPMMIMGPFKKISASRGHTCAITNIDVLQCWGRNAEKQTGNSANGDQASPYTHIGTLWKDVGTGIDFTCGITNDDRARCWGHDGNGQLGNNNMTGMTHTPQFVTTARTFASIVTGARHACALTSSGGAWCWGWNSDGQLGDATAITRNAPVELLGAWRKLALGERHSCGIHMDGTLACWGNNHYGQVGDGTVISKLEPVPVGTDADWAAVTVGNRHSCATKASGQTLCWGANHDGAVGNDAAWRPYLEHVTR